MNLHPMLLLLGARETPEPLGAGGPDLTRYLMAVSYTHLTLPTILLV